MKSFAWDLCLAEIDGPKHANSVSLNLHLVPYQTQAYVSEMYIFQNGTPCLFETCFRMTRVSRGVSERHTRHVFTKAEQKSKEKQ